MGWGTLTGEWVFGSIELVTNTAFNNTNASSRPVEVERDSIGDIDIPIYIRVVNFINFDGQFDKCSHVGGKAFTLKPDRISEPFDDIV